MTSRVRNQDGASLLIVIIFVMVFGVVISAVLDFASTGFQTTNAIADERGEQLAMDGAMDGAINAVRGSIDAGLEADEACTDDDFVYDGDPALGEPDVTVTCTGLLADSISERATMPEYAVLTLSPDECDGFLHTGHTPSSEHQVTIAGGIFSNGRIAVGNEGQNPACGPDQKNPGNPFMTVLGGVSAVAGCTPWDDASGRPTMIGVGTGGEIDCAADPESDPLYQPVVDDLSGMVVNPVATCVSSSTVVVYSPGVYTEHPLEIAKRGDGPGTGGCDGNNNDVWWFQPGVYYFDLTDNPETSSVDEALWDFADGGNAKSVVGGTLTGSLGAGSASSAFPFGSAPVCTTGEGIGGVQFIMGGTTRLATQSSNSPGGSRGDVELCGSAVADVPVLGGMTRNAELQHIALYGLREDQDVREEDTPIEQTKTTTPVIQNGVWGSSQLLVTAEQAATQIETTNDRYAFATLSAEPGKENAAMRFEFPDDVVPAGSLITSVAVRARHMETDPTLDVAMSIQAGDWTQNVDLSQVTTFSEQSEDIAADLSDVFTYEDVNDVTVTFNATGAALPCDKVKGKCKTYTAAEARLDAVVLDVSFVPPGFNALQCPDTEPDCAFLTTTNNPRVIFRGSVYTPTASYDVALQNGTEQLFQRGLIAWDIVARLSPSSGQTASPFQLPGYVQRRLVLFEASIDGAVRLRAKVAYTDDEATPGREVEVFDWVVVRDE